MPTQVQFRRGTTAQNNSFTGAAGEISVNTSNNTIRVHDGATAGGFELAKRGNVSVLTTGTSAELAAIISDETGSGALVFGTSPAITTSLTTPSASFDLINTTATTVNFAKAATAISIGAASGSTTVNNDLVVTGNVTVNGTTTTVNAVTVTVDDKNLELGSVATPTDVTADGGGITLRGATDKTINWSSIGWTSSEDFNLVTGKVYEINGTSVLSATTLGSGVTASSLTSVGTLSSLAVTNNVSAGAYLTTGNSTAANFQTAGNVNSASELVTGSLTAGTLQTAGNVNANNLRVVTNSSVGTVVSGTWQGTAVGTAYGGTGLTALGTGVTTALGVAVGSAGAFVTFNGALGTPSSGTLTNATGLPIGTGVSGLGAGQTTLLASAAASGVSAASYGNATLIPSFTVDTYGRITAASNVSITSGTAITDDTTTNSTRYISFTSATSGSISAANVSSTKLTFNPSTGLLTSTDYNSSSDKRLKKNIKTVESALDKVIALRGVTFDWKEGGAKAIGLIAQEAEKVIPEIVSQDDTGYLGIKYNNLIGVLVEAIKEQQDQINTLKKQIEKL